MAQKQVTCPRCGEIHLVPLPEGSEIVKVRKTGPADAFTLFTPTSTSWKRTRCPNEDSNYSVFYK